MKLFFISVVGIFISLFFQNCGKPLTTEQQEELSSQVSEISLAPVCKTGDVQSGYLTSSSLFPNLCGAPVSKVCLNGQWDKNVILSTTCTQMCINPQTNQPVFAGTSISTYSVANAVSQSGCNAQKVVSVCNQTSGTFLPAPVANTTCLVAGQTCAYSTGTGIAAPTGYASGATVTGYILSTATPPSKCNSQVTATCQAAGNWLTGSQSVTALYTSCSQMCLHPDSKQPVSSNSSYVYYTKSTGSASECNAAKVTSTCNATTGEFSPTVAPTRYANCTEVLPPSSGGTKKTPDFSVEEAPVSWNYQADKPSRAACASNEGTLYQVGPTRMLKTPKDVPWFNLVECDQVQIDYRDQPYTDVVYIPSRGSAGKYITIEGLPGPHGERPVFSGNSATTSTSLRINESAVEGSGLIIIGKPLITVKNNMYKPGYLHITGLRIANVHPDYKYTKANGTFGNWGAFVAGINARGTEHLSITNCEFDHNAMGIYVQSTPAFRTTFGNEGQSRWLYIARNYFHDNGAIGNYSVHHAYTEAIGAVFEYNYFGPLISGANGDGLKERSAGLILRYNYFEGGFGYKVALRDPADNGAYMDTEIDTLGDKLTKHVFIYSNIFLVRGGIGTVIGHGDGDPKYGSPTVPGLQVRWGNLFFYNNKVVSEKDRPIYSEVVTKLFETVNTRSPVTVVATNNLFYAKSFTSGVNTAPFALFTKQGKANFQSNWINNFVNTEPGAENKNPDIMTESWRYLYAGPIFDGSGLNGLTNQTGSPGFTNLAGGDFTSVAGSPFTLLNGTLSNEITSRGLEPKDVPVQTPQILSKP